jgi:hypothetical protein
MIRFIHCIKARPDINPEAFRAFWHSAEFTQLLSELAVLAGTRRIARNLTLQVEANNQLQMERQSRPAYDATLEIWFDNAAGLLRRSETSEFQALLKRLEALQAGFVDFHDSSRFFTEWLDE